MAFDINNLTDEQYMNIYGRPRDNQAGTPFVQWKQPWNSMELCDYATARSLVSAINSKVFDFGRADMDSNPPLPAQRPMGGGVIDGDDEKDQGPQQTSSAPSGPPVGIFVPPFYQMTAPTHVGPDGTTYYWLNLRFKNGAIINAGLFLDKLSRYPAFQKYAIKSLAVEVEQNGLAHFTPVQVVEMPDQPQASAPVKTETKA